MKRKSTVLRWSSCFLVLMSILVAPLMTTPHVVVAQSGGGSARVFFIRDGRIASARRTQTPQDISIFDGSLIELLRGPRPDERAAGLSTAFNELVPPTATVAYDEETKIATVDFSPDVAEMGERNKILGMAQVVFTLTQFNEIDGVLFKVGEVEVPALDGNGVAIDGPAVRADYEAVTPAIFVEAPEVLTAVRSPLRIRGTANTFEATFQYALYDADNVLLAEGFTTATSGSGTRGRFNESIEYELEEAGRGTLIVYESSAKDGSWINVVAIPLFLRATVAQPTATATATLTNTASPTATATSTSATIASQTPTSTPRTGITVVPTNTVRPTGTPRPTDIPAPTNPPAPTKTPQPTSTPKPTQTPQPTPTPKPTEIPTVSLTLIVEDCPPGMGIDNLVPSQCVPLVGGFDFRLTSRQHGIDLTLADAMRAGISFRWTDLPYGTYLLRARSLPDSSVTFFIPRSVSVEGSAYSGYSISLDEVSGNLEITVYLLNRWVEIAPF